MQRIVDHFMHGFERAAAKRSPGRRIGAELKFPFVTSDGRAVERQEVDNLFAFLEQNGWSLERDALTGKVAAARKPGPCNDSIAGCETGYCKIEFSLAHVADLHELDAEVSGLRSLLGRYSDEHGCYLLGNGIQPVTPPGKHLEMKKGRNVFWDRIFGSNRAIKPEDGDDVHLFTVSASSQVHVDVSLEEAAPAVNLFNGFSPAQIALCANSNIWKGRLDPEHKCVGELFWDWWIPGTDRYGIPPRPFRDLDDYVRTVASLPPVYVKRDGVPYGLPGYRSFYQYFAAGDEARGIDAEGNQVRLEPVPADFDQHCTFYWYNARISRYHTLENRVCDQQPPGDLLCVAAMTLGLVSALEEGVSELASCDWDTLRAARAAACRQGLSGRVGDFSVAGLAFCMLQVAEHGLDARGRGEERYLDPLLTRLKTRRCPADDAAAIFGRGGVPALVAERGL